MEYRWDRSKARTNLAKHGIDFADAVTALEDELALSIPDPDAEGEERFIRMGADAGGRVLVTVYSQQDGCTRIISARRATPRERRRYEETQ